MVICMRTSTVQSNGFQGGIPWNPVESRGILDPPQSQKKSHDDVGIYLSILARVIIMQICIHIFISLQIYIYIYVHRIQYKISVLVNSCNLFSLTIAVMIHLHTHMHIYIVFILDHVVRGHPHHTHATRIRERTNLLDVQSWSWRAETSALVFLGDYVTWLGEPWGNP